MWLFKAFGVAHLAFAFWGAYLIWFVVLKVVKGDQLALTTDYKPDVFQAWIVMTSINVLYVAGLAIGGYLLLRKRTSGVLISNVLFVSLFAYMLGIGAIWALGGPFARVVSSASGIGNMGTTPLLMTGYPLVALIGLNLTRRKLRKLESETRAS